MLFKNYWKVNEFPKKEQPRYLFQTFRQLVIYVYVLCLKYIWICFMLTERWNLDTLDKVHSGCGNQTRQQGLSMT